jgi:hypothetical protein
MPYRENVVCGWDLAVWLEHPPTQWNLRGGRGSSVEYRTFKENMFLLQEKVEKEVRRSWAAGFLATRVRDPHYLQECISCRVLSADLLLARGPSWEYIWVGKIWYTSQARAALHSWRQCFGSALLSVRIRIHYFTEMVTRKKFGIRLIGSFLSVSVLLGSDPEESNQC